MTDPTTAAPGAADDFASLEHAASQADAISAQSIPVSEGGQLGAPPPPDYQAEAGAMVETFAALVTGYSPKAGALWSNEAKTRTIGALAPVLQKYGITLGTLPVELILAITAGPLLYQTSKVIAAQMAAEKATTVAAKPPAGPAPAPEPVGPGVHDQVKLYP